MQVGFMEKLVTSFLSFICFLIDLMPSFVAGGEVELFSSGNNFASGFNEFIQGFNNALDWFGSILATVNFVIPVETIILIAWLAAGEKIIMFGFFAVNWIVRRIADIIP